MRRFRLSLWLVLVPALCMSCTSTKTVWRSEPQIRKAGNEYFNAELSAYCRKAGCLGFNLLLENKSHRDIEIDWSQTAYLKNGVESGGFTFEGIILKERKDRKPLETVVAYGLLSKKIVPEILTFPGRAQQQDMGPGEHGIRLVVKADGREISERVIIHILKMEVPE
jgi:hypothetical protein